MRADVVTLARALLAGLDPLTERLVDDILAEDTSYSGPGRLTREDLHRSCRRNLHDVLATLTGDSGPDRLESPRTTGMLRAEQGVPLESVLHAYRLGFRTIWQGMVAEARSSGAGIDGLVDAATEVWSVVDVFSGAVADAYRTTESDLARRDDRRRDALTDALLDGQGAERAIARDAAAALDLPEHGPYVVVLLDGTQDGATAASALTARGLRSAWRTRTDTEIGLVALGSLGPADVAEALDAVPTTRAGVSPVVEGLAELDVGHRLAVTALQALPPGERCVAALDTRLPAALLVTAPDLAGRLLSRALGGVLALDADERDVLLDTLRVWLATGGSAGETATRLYCHRNTVLNRLHRLEALTGRSLERADDLVEWSLALLALDVLPRPAPGR